MFLVWDTGELYYYLLVQKKVVNIIIFTDS